MPDDAQLEAPRGRGRPIEIVEKVIQDLESVFRLGGSVSAACAYARISRQTFYVRMNSDEEFAMRIENAKNYAVIAARKIVVTEMLKDVDATDKEGKIQKLELAKWYLDRHDVKSSGNTQQTQINVFQGLRDQFTKKPETDVSEDVEPENEPLKPEPTPKPHETLLHNEKPKVIKINLAENEDADANQF